MARLPGARFDITGASGSQGLLGPKESWRAYVFPRGAYAAQDSTGPTVTLDSVDATARFTTGDWVQVGISVDNIRRVSAIDGDPSKDILLNAPIVVSENDRVFIIGSTQPTVTGGSATYETPNTVILKRDDDAADRYTNSMITSDANGLIQFFSEPNHVDCIIQDGNQTNQGSVIDLSVGLVEGLSTAQSGIVGGTLTVTGPIIANTVTVNMALGVTGTATFGSTVTINANGEVDRWKTALEPVVNVMHSDYAALGDGSNDDATEIGAAITAAGTSGTVWLPPGEFVIHSNLTLSGGVRLIGSGADRTVIRVGDAQTATIFIAGDNVEIAHLTIDGNHANNASSTSHGIVISAGTDDVWIHDTKIMNCPNRGIICNGTTVANNRIVIENNYITNIGFRGVELFYVVDSRITDNTVIRCGGHALIVDTGTDQDTDYSRRCVISRNIVDRSSAPDDLLTGRGSESGFLIGFGGGSEDILIEDNNLRGSTSAGHDDGIGWGHTAGGKVWKRVNIIGNLVREAGAFGIDVVTDSIVSNNTVLNSGTHGIVVAHDNDPDDFGTILIKDNIVIDSNATNNSADISGIVVGFSGGGGCDSIRIEGNNIMDRRAAPRMTDGIKFSIEAQIVPPIGSFIIKNNTVIRGSSAMPFYGVRVIASGVSSGIVGFLDISGNDLSGIEGTGTSRSIFFSGNTHSNITKLKVRDNSCIVNDPYSGEVVLSSGTATVQNTSWPEIEGVRFAHWRRIRGSGTVGAIGTSYDNVDSVVITSRETGAGENSTIHWEFIGTDD